MSEKNWRDVDRKKDQSSHRQADAGGEKRMTYAERSQKSYRSKLDRLFDSGKISSLVPEKDGGQGEPGSPRQTAYRAVLDAEGRADITKSVDKFLKHGELPEDFTFLEKVLSHRNPSRQFDAMEKIDTLLETERPKRSASMVSQLKAIRDMADEKDVIALADKLIDTLS